MENNEPKDAVKESQDSVKPEHHAVHHERKPMGEKLKSNPWIISSVVLGVIVLVLLVNTFSGMTGGVTGVSEDVAAQAILDFANSQTGGGVELVKVNEKYGLYEVIVNYNDEEIPLYITKDGKNLVQGVTPLSAFEEKESEPAPEAAPAVTKSDKPEVELFIMTHCPYGTQAEKGFIPMIKAMGSLIDAKIRFVHYFMHDPEETETPIQVCIREEQSAKYLDYLECFLEDGNSSRCLDKVGIDEDDLNDCLENGNAEKYYAEDSNLSKEYGVQGSPTLVVNGAIVSSGRNPTAYLTTVCSAFNTAPDECSSLELSSENPSPGFGYSATGSNTQAQC